MPDITISHSVSSFFLLPELLAFIPLLMRTVSPMTHLQVGCIAALSPSSPSCTGGSRYRLLFRAMVEASVREGGERWGARFGLHTAGVGTAAVVRWYCPCCLGGVWSQDDTHRGLALDEQRGQQRGCDIAHDGPRPTWIPQWRAREREKRTGKSLLSSTSLQLSTAFWLSCTGLLYVWRGPSYRAGLGALGGEPAFETDAASR